LKHVLICDSETVLAEMGVALREDSHKSSEENMKNM